MYLVMLETNGNQPFIFSSPRLRENIGASYQLTRLREWTQEALSISEESPQWVSRSSGKVIVRTDSEEEASELIRCVTATAAAQAPGLDVTGVYMDLGETQFITAAHLKEIHILAAQYALKRRASHARFAQMSFLTRAKDSNLPASTSLSAMFGEKRVKDESRDDRKTPYSLPSRVNRYMAHPSRSDLVDAAVTSDGPSDYQHLLVRDPEKLREFERILQRDSGIDEEQGLSKVAVIHIDGNGVGAIMSRLNDARCKIPASVFKDIIGVPEGRCGAGEAELQDADSDSLRRFVLEINERFEKAVRDSFGRACVAVAETSQSIAKASEDNRPMNQTIPIVPVILGGDDVTVITTGDCALVFTQAFLAAYEDITSEDPLLKYLSNLDSKVEETIGPMTAGAGVAIVRRNFPFHIAYDLAEGLVKEAKKIGKRTSPPRSSLSFHVLFDTTVLDSEAILKSYSSFTKRPYFLHSTTPTDETTADHPTWQEVIDRVKALRGFFEAEDDSNAASQKTLSDSSETDDDSTAESQEAPVLAFPRTRAARIRKLLSERAVANAIGNTRLADENYRRVQREWANAKEHYPAACERIGSPEALFDLMELVDLLPSAYIRQQSSPPATTKSIETAHTSPTPDDHSEVNE